MFKNNTLFNTKDSEKDAVDVSTSYVSNVVPKKILMENWREKLLQKLPTNTIDCDIHREEAQEQ